MAARMDIPIRQALGRYLTGWGSLGAGLKRAAQILRSWRAERRVVRSIKVGVKGRHCCLERGVAEGHGA